MSSAATDTHGDVNRLEQLRALIRRHWGFDALRPLQEPAMQAVLQGRDSLLVMPTGGGKSLCYQAPAVLRGDTTVVVSPLISLMKDQVDALRANGVPAVSLNSSLSGAERHEAERAVRAGQVRLLFVSPERLATEGFRRLAQEVGVRSFAIDEAHCISHWGHDFRPDYRQLSRLKDLFPEASIHGFTATATEPVRQDIVAQLNLRDPDVLVGSFDRPNLTYRVLRRNDVVGQALEVIHRHRGEAGIIYCIRRRDVDELTEALKDAGIAALPYHAGLPPEERKTTQDAFAEERCNLVVATVAFGMGIDRSNIRYILHTGMPKSIEHYQQETGRAGRDGLEAECVLLYSPADAMLWRKLVEKSAAESEVEVHPAFLQTSFKHIADMEGYCQSMVCRHRVLVEYFGQRYEAESCRACDLCLDDAELLPDGHVVAQKILSCVARVGQKFGVNHVIDVLRGAETEAIRKWGHEKLSTYGLLREHRKTDIRNWISQLIGQQALVKTAEEYPVLTLNPASWDVMNDRRTAKLLQPPSRRRKKTTLAQQSSVAADSWEGVDRDLFETLRELRRELAEERGHPPYVIFNDATLRELARVRPSSTAGMGRIYGIGEAKLQDFGPRFFKRLDEHCRSRGLSRDNPPAHSAASSTTEAPPRPLNAARRKAFALFAEGRSIEDVRAEVNRAQSTTVQYLVEYIERERPESISSWVPDEIYHQVAQAAERVGTERLKPIFEALDGRVPYDQIRLVRAHLQSGTTDKG